MLFDLLIPWVIAAAAITAGAADGQRRRASQAARCGDGEAAVAAAAADAFRHDGVREDTLGADGADGRHADRLGIGA